ncbi:uncharacterized protein wuc [Drosophila kikkawai]|uniref:Uncharacterized protein wuc n=1 Tax=Drosophila kikkawai TaxID=30033 RepID=A0A6P4IFR4_DROKI|nr:uncharacterized protein LOC108078066 [Drosophila kikkawai]
MKNIQKSIKKGQSPNADAESTNDLPEMEKLDNAGSSNEETEEETEQDREEVDSMIVEMDEKEMQEGTGGQEKFSEMELRIMNELKELSPTAMVAEIELLEKELFEYSQREAREITRSKHLDILGKNRRRSSK